MVEDLLHYYNSELVAIRRLAGEFAAANPKAAARLRLTAENVDDPHVGRLLEGLAFLAARVQQRLDDEVPELYEALLDLLCPHLLAPFPSMMTVRLLPKPEAKGPSTIQRLTPFETQAVDGEMLRYRSCHEVTLWPVAIDKARLSGLPLQAPVNPLAPGAVGVLRLSLVTTVPDLTFADVGLDRLRLHLSGQEQQAARLLELLCTSTLSVAVANGPGDTRPTLLPREALCQVGFDAEEAALPWPQRAFAGHRLLTEYFAYPEKFLYLEISGLEARSQVQASRSMELFVYLSRSPGELERIVNETQFVLGATPAVNLFDQPAEPIKMDGTKSEWRVVADSRRPRALEVYSVEQVSFSRPDAPQPREVRHFQHLRHKEGGDATSAAEGMSWLASRRPASARLGGTETHLALREPGFDPSTPADGVLTVDTLCCNRDLPRDMPFGGGQPAMKVIDPAAPASGLVCLSPATPTLRPPLRDRSGWRLVSHLALNHLAMTGGEDAARALREMLRLHDLRGSAESSLALDGLVAVDVRPGIARLQSKVRAPGAEPGSGIQPDYFARGLDVMLTFDPQAWAAGGLYVLAAVLERYFEMQVSINGFVRTSVQLRGRSGIVASWPARTGTRVLL